MIRCGAVRTRVFSDPDCGQPAKVRARASGLPNDGDFGNTVTPVGGDHDGLAGGPADHRLGMAYSPCPQPPDWQESSTGATRQGSAFRTLRLAMLSLGLLLAAFLVARGQYLLGAVIAGLAVVRLVFVLHFARRRRFAGPTVSAPARELLRSLVRGEFEAAANAIGQEPDTLHQSFLSGRSIRESARAAGVPLDTVIDAIIGYAQTRIDQLVGEGAVAETTAAQAKERLPLWATRFVERRSARSRWTRDASWR